MGSTVPDACRPRNPHAAPVAGERNCRAGGIVLYGIRSWIVRSAPVRQPEGHPLTSFRAAYFCEPQVGGTFTYFRRLRPALAARGIDFRCVAPLSAERFKGTRFEGEEGVDFIPLAADLPTATRQAIEHLRRENYALVMVLPGADPLSTQLPRYLPRSIRCAMHVPMMTRGAYVPTQALAPHLDRIVAVSDRIGDDLVRRYGLPPEQVEVIFHGVDPAPFADALDRKSTAGALRLLYAGRLCDVDKGVFLLPPMMKSLRAAGVAARLTLAGGGPDAEELRARFEKTGIRDDVELLGPVPLERMNELYRAADVFVFPSRFEGCGFAALEAMAAGCAPVMSDIRGSLRVLADAGAAGRLARVGDARDFARAIRDLAADRAELKRLQRAARERVLARFTLERMADDTARLFEEVRVATDRRAAPDSLDRYEIPAAFRPTWRTKIPRPIKNWIRTWMERLGRST